MNIDALEKRHLIKDQLREVSRMKKAHMEALVELEKRHAREMERLVKGQEMRRQASKPHTPNRTPATDAHAALRADLWEHVAQPAIAVRKRMQLEKNNPTYAKKYPDYVAYCEYTYACTKEIIAKLRSYKHDVTQPHTLEPTDLRMDWREHLSEDTINTLLRRWRALGFAGIGKPERSYPPLPAPAGLAQQTQNPTETSVSVDNPA